MLYSPAFFALYTANLAIVASFTCYFLFPLYVTSHGGDSTEIGVLMGVFALASALCRPWISPLIDRFGRKSCLSTGCIIMAALPLCYPLLDQSPLPLYSLIMLRMVHGVGMAVCFTSVFTFIADLVPAARLNEGIGLFGTSGLIGIAVGPSLAEWALLAGGFNGLFFASALLAMLALIVHLPIKDRADRFIHQRSSAGFFQLLRQPRYARVALFAVLFGVGVSTTGNFIAPLCDERNLELVTPFFVSYSLAAIATRLFVGRLADRVGERCVLPWAFLVCATGLLLVLPALNYLLLSLAGLVCGAGHGLLFPTLNTLAIRDVPADYRGRVTGIFTGAIDSGIFLGSIGLGAAARLFPLSALFLISAALLLIAWGMAGRSHSGTT